MPKLTKTVIDKAELRPTPYFLWDASLPGFGVRVFPSGRKIFYVDYRVDRSRRRMNIGVYGKLTPDEARDEAVKLLGSVVKGEDPLLERKTRRKSLTVAELCDDYIASAEKGLVIGKGGRGKKASTLEIDRGRIERHVKPLLGRRLVIDIRSSDIVKFMRDVATGKTAKKDRSGKNGARVEVTGGTGTASRTVGLLGGIMTFAMAEGVIDANPVAGVRRPADNSRDRRLTADEYRAIGRAIETAESAAIEPWQTTAGARLVSLTGCRIGEIEHLKRSEVDAAGGCFRLEDSKEGASVRPVGRAALEVIASLPQSDSPYVLPSARKGDDRHFRALPAGWTRLMKAAGLTGVTPHTMRHSFASVAGDMGFADSTISAMLGHSVGTVTSRYVHRLDAVLIAAANKVAAEVERQMFARTADVVALPKRA